jgi:hypothetical protein
MNPSGGSGGSGGSNWVKPTKPSTPPAQKIQTTPKTPPPKWTPAVKTTPPAQLIGPVNQGAKPAIGVNRSVAPCPLKKHFVKVKLVFKDDQSPVLATAAQILKGKEVVDGGPLGNGELGTATTLDPGSYEVTFPDIDSAEWDVG